MARAEDHSGYVASIFSRRAMLIEAAYEAARSFLGDLDVTGAGPDGSP